ncbi:unnamed protein product, partial [Polarella glacialis]
MEELAEIIRNPATKLQEWDQCISHNQMCRRLHGQITANGGRSSRARVNCMTSPSARLTLLTTVVSRSIGNGFTWWLTVALLL